MTRHQLIDFDFDKYPIELKTNSEIGSQEDIDVVFYVPTETNINDWTEVGNVWIVFSDPMTYRIYHCSELTAFNVDVPEETNKIWKIVKTSSEMRIICNGIELVKIQFEKVFVILGIICYLVGS